VLTEAVRRRPYSVVLLDEVEKAHSDVHEIFFQVFDKGEMEDGEGRFINFRNTLILLTTNVGSELIASLCRDPELMPEPEAITKALREPLLKVFPAALLGRLVTIPYYPLTDEMMGDIIRLQLGRIERRVRDNHALPFTYDDDVVKLIAQRCTELDSGGRMIDAILTNTVLPRISAEMLTRLIEGRTVGRVHVAGREGGLRLCFRLTAIRAWPVPRHHPHSNSARSAFSHRLVRMCCCSNGWPATRTTQPALQFRSHATEQRPRTSAVPRAR